MNIAESAALRITLQERGWLAAANENDADLVIINTCSVRITAEQRVKGRLAYYTALKKKLTPAPLTVLVTGCMASRIGSALIESGADFVLGTEEKQFFPAILEAIEAGKKDIAYNGRTENSFIFSKNYYTEGTFRSFVPIMHGCNNFCSYCIVPYVRGREISRSPSEIIFEINELAKKGVLEITLLGQNVNSYLWEDGSKKYFFADLLKIIAGTAAGTSIKWVRFLSSHPKDLSENTINVIKENNCFCRHIHLCVQHGSNKILKAMNRRYTRERYLELVDTLRCAMPGITISTDILVGFPGETEADFEEILTLMESVKFLYSYMYHYNPREGTAAFTLPDRVDDETKKRRLSCVIELQQKHTRLALCSRLGTNENVLIEGVSKKNRAELVCRTERDEMAVAAGGVSGIGSFAKITLDSINGNTFRGTFIL